MEFVRTFQDIFAHLFHPRRSNNHRARLIHPESIFLLVLVAGGFVALLHLFIGLSGPSKKILGFASSITPKEVIAATNDQRSKMGLPPLALNQALTAAAIAKGQDMFNDQYWAHTAPDGTEPWVFMRQAGYSYRVAGENLARDFSETPAMMTAWMASPTHRANIVNPQYSEIGIAVIDGVLEGYETTLVVQMFGAPEGRQATVTEVPAVRAVQATEPVNTITEIDQLIDDKPGAQDLAVLETNGDDEPEATAGGEETAATDEELVASISNVLTQGVLASMLVPIGEIETPPLFTPLQLTKAFFLAVIMLIILTLIYDTFVIGNRQSTRLVGRNLAHIILFLTVAFLVVFFKGGIVG